MFRFNQSTGEVTHQGSHFSWSYSGHGNGVNNPSMQYVPGIGPIPVGTYTIGPPFVHPHAGAVCMRLTPNPGTDDHGRDGFMWHGDNIAANHTASEGCIISPRVDREAAANAVNHGDNQLEVVSQ
jgi:hypothetical protein